MSSSDSDRERFLKLIEQNENRLLRICRVYGRTREEREDLFQEILLNTWRALPTYSAHAAASTWLYRIALNVSMKSVERSRKHAARQEPLEGLSFQYGVQATPTAEVEKAERVDRLYDCIGQLEPVDRSIMLLYLDDLSHAQIASVVGISANYVGVKINRIKRKLLACLEAGS